MHKARHFMGAAILLVLVGCGGAKATDADGGAAEAGTGDRLAADDAGAARLRRGLWKMEVTVAEAGLPNMPVDGARPKQKKEFKLCLASQAASPTILSGRFDDTCRTDGFENQNGRVSGTITCGGDDGAPVITIRTEGTVTPTAFQTTSRSEIVGEAKTMTSRWQVAARREGKCPADMEPGTYEDNMGKKRIGG